MNTNESKVARQYRLQQWAEQIRNCNDRPVDLSVKDWCYQNDISPANYYYRLREVRKACLATLPTDQASQQLVPVSTELTSSMHDEESVLEITVNGAHIRVTNHTSPELLSMVIQVVSNVK